MWTGSGWVYFFKLQAWFYCRIWPNSHHWGICPGSPTGQVGWLIQAYCPGFAKEQVELRVLFTLVIIACPWLAAGEKPVQCLVGAGQSSWQEVKSCVLRWMPGCLEASACTCPCRYTSVCRSFCSHNLLSTSTMKRLALFPASMLLGYWKLPGCSWELLLMWAKKVDLPFSSFGMQVFLSSPWENSEMCYLTRPIQ